MSEETRLQGNAPHGKVVGSEDQPTGPARSITEGEMTSPGADQSGSLSMHHAFLSQLYAEPTRTDEPIMDIRRGMWGDGHGSADTSGFSGMTRLITLPGQCEPPFGGWFDDVANRLAELVPHFALKVSIWRGRITFFVKADKLLELARVLRDDEQLRFEACMSVSGVHYPNDHGAQLHVVYQMLSFTHNRCISLEVAVDENDPHIDSLTSVYPMVNYHERETWDMFGVIFDGHPALTRILMPDDWVGHPQRKDYPLGGIPIEYKGAVVPPPHERRSYQA